MRDQAASCIDPSHQLPCLCESEIEAAHPHTNGVKVNGHVTRGHIVDAIDFARVSRETTARLLRAARRLARG